MEQKYLIDTNVVIDYLDDKLPEISSSLIDDLIPHISVITRMELLGWKEATNEQLKVLEQFINESEVHPIDEPVIVKVVELRRSYTIKLPDAIIAATASINDLTLLTRNVKDFKQISDLKLLNPYEG